MGPLLNWQIQYTKFVVIQLHFLTNRAVSADTHTYTGSNNNNSLRTFLWRLAVNVYFTIFFEYSGAIFQCFGSASFWCRSGSESEIPFDADPDPYTDPTHKFYTYRTGAIFFHFYSQRCQSKLLYLSHQCHRCHNLQSFGQNIETFWKKYCLSLHLLEMDTDTLSSAPDPSGSAGPGCQSERIRIHNTAVFKLAFLYQPFNEIQTFSELHLPLSSVFSRGLQVGVQQVKLHLGEYH